MHPKEEEYYSRLQNKIEQLPQSFVDRVIAERKPEPYSHIPNSFWDFLNIDESLRDY